MIFYLFYSNYSVNSSDLQLQFRKSVSFYGVQIIFVSVLQYFIVPGNLSGGLAKLL